MYSLSCYSVGDPDERGVCLGGQMDEKRQSDNAQLPGLRVHKAV